MTSIRLASQWLWSLPLAAPILAASYVLNAGLELGVHANSILRPFGIAVASTAVVTAVLVRLTPNRAVAGIGAVGLLVLVISGGAIGTVLTRTPWWQAAIWVVLWVAAGGLTVRIFLRQRRRRRLVPRSQVMNIFAAALLGTVVTFGVINGRLPELVSTLATDQSRTEPTTDEPDIILLILDGYPRADTLARIFDFDNSSFLHGLEQQGFAVSGQARSNYAWTELTMLSMLHMRHATDIETFKTRSAEPHSQPWLRTLTSNNPVFSLVREAGYRVMNIATNMDHTTLRGADIVLTPPGFTDFEIHLLSSSALSGVLSISNPSAFAQNHRDQVLWGLETLEREASRTVGGRLIIAHVLSPHMPAVLHRDGTLRPVEFDHAFYYDFRALVGTPRDEWNAAFRDQVGYLNTRVLDTLRRVTEANPAATIIVLSDHGSGSEYQAGSADTDFAERYGILFAARNPGAPDALAEVMTPVNVFPALLNRRLGLSLPMQPDTSYGGYLQLWPLPDGALR